MFETARSLRSMISVSRPTAPRSGSAATSWGTENLYRVPLAGGVPTLVVQGGAVGAFDPGASVRRLPEAPLWLLPPSWSPSDTRQHRAATRHDERALARQCASFRRPRVCAGHRRGRRLRCNTGSSFRQGFDASKPLSGRLSDSRWCRRVTRPTPGPPAGTRRSGGAGLDRGGAEPAGLDRVRPAVRGRDQPGLVRQGDDRSGGGVRHGGRHSPTRTRHDMGIAGASYGGFAVDWLIGHTNRFKAAVSHDGVFNLESMSFRHGGALVPGVGVSAARRGPNARARASRAARRTASPTGSGR